MALTAREAAEAVGLSKAAILKAIRTGKISATKNYNGEWMIEPVELFRRYAPVSADGIQPAPTAPVDTTLEAEIANLRQQLADKDQQLGDLRRWLDAAMAALPPRPQLTGKSPPSFWRRLFAPRPPK